MNKFYIFTSLNFFIEVTEEQFDDFLNFLNSVYPEYICCRSYSLDCTRLYERFFVDGLCCCYCICLVDENGEVING